MKSRIYITVITVLAAFVSTHSTVTQAWGQTDTTATVAAWNIEDGTSHDDRIDAIADGVLWLDAEVIVLTEASNTSRMNQLVEELTKRGAVYSLHMEEQGRDRDHIAILAKDGVTVSDVGLLAGSDDGNAYLRKALTAKVTIGKFDFVLVGVHMKASRDATSRGVRTRQAEVIATFITGATSSAEKDVLIVGDYNMIPPSATSTNDQENFQAMNPNSTLFFVSSEDLAGQGSHIKDNGRIGNLLDGYAVSAENTDEYIDGSLRIFPLHRTYRLSLKDYGDNVADHLPLVARFVVTVDDD